MKIEDLSGEDRKQVERFSRYLRIIADAPPDLVNVPPASARRLLVTDETHRYLLEEDVEPVQVDDEHPAKWSIRALGFPRPEPL